MLRRALIAACFLLSAAGAAAQYARAPEYEVKAAFLYNFAKFVDWPSQAFPAASTPLRICVLGQDPFGDALNRIVRGKPIAGRSIVNQQVQSLSEARACHILFISRSNPDSLKQALDHMRGVPVLTVGENSEFLSLGGMVKFVLEEDRVRFEISLAAAERHGLKISSKLLAVARVVDVGGGAN